MKVIGISRGSQYSPNHVGNDAAIFRKVMEELCNFGCEVVVYSETELGTIAEAEADIVVSMARDDQTLNVLHAFEQKGIPVVNSPYGVENCVRRPMTEILLNQAIPHPRSWVLSLPLCSDLSQLSYPCWIKRGDSHAMVKEDVCYVTTCDEAAEVLADFQNRSIPTAVINEHLQGDLVKFYGVSNTDFFYWFYPSSSSHSKFGLEKINGLAKGIPFAVDALKDCANKAAEALHVPVYGGDAIVLSDGMVKLIDFNDWPSFAPCRDEAGHAIADYVMKLLSKSK